MKVRYEVVLSLPEWDEIRDKLDRFEAMETELEEYRRRDREYFEWSTDFGARMKDALEFGRKAIRFAENYEKNG